MFGLRERVGGFYSRARYSNFTDDMDIFERFLESEETWLGRKLKLPTS